MEYSLFKTQKLEIFKLKKQGFWFMWIIMTAILLAWTAYVSDYRDLDLSRNFVTGVEVYYLRVQSSVTMILSLFMPVMASLLISKLADQEHKGDTWRLLLTNNQNLKAIWDVKFFLVFILMELTCLAAYTLFIAMIYFQLRYPIPIKELAVSFLGISCVNSINLTVSQVLAFFYQNQIIAVVEGLLAGFLSLISSLMPIYIVRFLPCCYYTLMMLSGVKPLGKTADGFNQWQFFAVKPELGLVLIVTALFIILYFVFRNLFAKKEF